MSNDNNARLFDDLTRVAGGAVSVFSALGKQLQAGLHDQMGKNFGGSTSARAEDIERLMGVVSKLRTEQEDLKARITELESQLGIKKSASTPAKKASSAKSSTKAKAAPSKKSTPKKSARK